MSYGQYSHASTAGERLKVSDVKRECFDALEVKKAGHNRFILTNPDGSRRYRYHHTNVVTISKSPRDGKLCVHIKDGGWPTVTTRRAINQAFAALGLHGWGIGSIWRKVKANSAMDHQVHTPAGLFYIKSNNGASFDLLTGEHIAGFAVELN